MNDLDSAASYYAALTGRPLADCRRTLASRTPAFVADAARFAAMRPRVRTTLTRAATGAKGDDGPLAVALELLTTVAGDDDDKERSKARRMLRAHFGDDNENKPAPKAQATNRATRPHPTRTPVMDRATSAARLREIINDHSASDEIRAEASSLLAKILTPEQERALARMRGVGDAPAAVATHEGATMSLHPVPEAVALARAKELAAQGVGPRPTSLPSLEAASARFDAQRGR